MKTTIKVLCIVALTLTRCLNPASANPVGGSVVGGDGNATITGQGTAVTTINQSANQVIINWQDFSIGAGEITRFLQPSDTAAALNRVTSGNPSQIYGSLQANGRVFVINPNGILIGPGGQIDTKGFVASTLDVPDASFLSGASLIFSGSSGAAVRNQGSIQALGGDVYLIAHQVENDGTISAPQGTAGLAAGSQVQLVQSGNEHLSVLAGNASAPTPVGVNNAGVIQAASAELKAAGGNIYALAINNGGVVRATGIINKGGHVYLAATGGNIQNSGTLAANRADGSGGTVILDGGHNAADPATVINSGVVEARGDTAGTKGGTVEILGDQVELSGNAVVDASGDSGGGTALIGGDTHGANPAVPNATTTTVDAGAQIHADALNDGNAGKVVVWSDDTTKFNGTISARALGADGDGGFAEISGRQHLQVNGYAYLGGADGQKGQLLLDPGSVNIQHEASGQTPPSANLDVFFDDYLVNQLNTGGADVTVSTANSLNGNTEDLTLETGADLSWNSANSLSLIGNNSVTLQSGSTIANLGTGNLTLQSGSGAVALNGTLNLAAGLTVDAAGALAINHNITAASVATHSGTSGSGDTTFASGVVVQADTQSYRAGDGTGSTAAVNFHPTPTPPQFLTTDGSAQPTSFAYRQDAAIADSDFPDASQFGPGPTHNPPANYNIQSDGGSVALSTEQNFAGSALTLFGAAGVTFSGVGALNVASLDVSSDGAISFSKNLTANSVISHSGMDGTGDTTFGNITIQADTQSYRAGDGTSGAGSSAAVSLAGANTVFLATAGGAVAPASFTYRQDGAISSGDFPSALRFGGTLPAAFAVESDDGGVQLAGLSLPGTLQVTANGDITESGALTVNGGSSTFTYSGAALGNVLLASAGNNFGGQTITINASGGGAVQDVALRNVSASAGFNHLNLPTGLRNLTVQFDAAPITLPTLSLGGNLSVTAGGAVTQSGAVAVNGTTSVNAGGNGITLNDAGNNFAGAVTVNNSGANDVTLNNGTHALTVGGGVGRDLTTSAGATAFNSTTVGRNLAVTASGAVTQSGAVAVSGTTSVGAGGHGITLNDAGNNFAGAVTVNNSGANDVTLNNGANALTVGGGVGRDLTTSAAATAFNSTTVGRNLTVTANGDITESGALTVSGGSSTFTYSGAALGNVLLASAGNNFGGQTITISANGGGVVQDVALRNVSASAGFNHLNLPAGLRNLTVQFDAAPITLPTLSLGGNLSVTAGGAVTQSGAVAVNGTTSVNAGGNGITLNDVGNNFAGAVTVNNSGANDVTLNNGVNPLTVGGGVGRDLTTSAGATAFDSTTVGRNLSVTAGGAVTQSGAVAVNGTASVNAGGNGITLNDAGNNFAGAVTVNNSGANDVTLNNGTHALTVGGGVGRDLTTSAGATAFDPTTVGGNLTVTAGGAVTQSGAVAVNGTASVNAGANGITLNDAGNNFAGAVTVNNSGANDVTLNNGANTLTVGGGVGRDLTTSAGATAFNPTTVGGNLAVTAGGAVTQSGAVAVNGTASVDAGANGITLNDAGNNFAGAVTVNNSGANDVTLNNGANALTVGGGVGQDLTTSAGAMAFNSTTVGRNLTVTANGDITENGALTVNGGSSTFTYGGLALGNVLLASAGNDFGGQTITINANGGGAVQDVALRNVSASAGFNHLNLPAGLRNLTVQFDAAPMMVPALSISGTMDLTSGGPVAQTGPLGASALQVTAAGPVVLDNPMNQVGTIAGSVSGLGNGFSFADLSPLTVGVVDSVSGLTTANGDITLTADSMDIAQAVDSGTANTTLQPLTPARNINLGPTEVAGELNLSQGELDEVTASILLVNTTAGIIFGKNTVLTPPHVTTLQLSDSGGTSQIGSAQLAGLSQVEIPVPRLETTTFSTASLSVDEAAKILPPGSIGTLWLQIPFPPTKEAHYRIEDVSKWTSGPIAAMGGTSGPQEAK